MVGPESSYIDAPKQGQEKREALELSAYAVKQLSRPAAFAETEAARYAYDKCRSKGPKDRHTFTERGKTQYSTLFLPPERQKASDPASVHENGKEFYLTKGTSFIDMNVIGATYNAAQRFPISFKHQLEKPLFSKEWDKWSPEQRVAYAGKLKRTSLILEMNFRQKHASVGEVLEDIGKIIAPLKALWGKGFITAMERETGYPLDEISLKIAGKTLEWVLPDNN